MRKVLGFTGLLAVFVFALTASPVSAGSSPLTVATGSFTLHASDFGGPNGANRTVAFSVQQRSDGTVTGQLQSRSFGGNVSHGNINCFVRDGNKAIVGGVFTAFSQDPTLVGAEFAFAIQDNPDVSTFIFFGVFDPSVSACDQFLGSFDPPEPDIGSVLNDFGLPITTGNIRIGP